MTIFSDVSEGLPTMDLIREVFTFVDVSQLVSKLTTCDNRDKAINAGLDKFNNQTASQVTADPQARFGRKGNNKFWFAPGQERYLQIMAIVWARPKSYSSETVVMMPSSKRTI